MKEYPEWPNISRQRRIEWWALLNIHETPEDFPLYWSESEVFALIEKEISKWTLLAFWNGDFNRGLNRDSYITTSAKPLR